MATVKGDVHDIGKNIVGVVLACNNYEVIDLGVMVSAQKILETARREKVDVIGLSGLITPSLDEMVNVASEMEREGFDIPLLIGGATTSRVHTAVKIHPNYHKGQAVYVTDASRAVGVVSSLLSPEMKDDYVETLRAEYRKVADAHARSEADKQRLPSRRRAPTARRSTGRAYQPPKPTFTGARVFRSYDVGELVPYIDWTPFFQTWELKGRYPAILEDEKQGAAARQLLGRRAGDAQAARRRALVQSESGDRLLACERGRRRHPPLIRARAATRSLRPSTACGSSSRSATASPISACPISSRRVESGKPDYDRRLRGHVRASRKCASPRSSSARTTITVRSS